MAQLNTIHSAYFIGIKGAGMTALATLLHARGVRVSGSDTVEQFHTDQALRDAGILVVEGFAARNIPDDIDCVIHSTTYTPENNPEMQALAARDVLVLSYPEALGILLAERCGVAVAGTHGKTTVTALLAHVLQVAGVEPAAIVGAYVPQWHSNALTGEGQYFVAEADEYQNKLMHYTPFAAVLTNIDWDHPDFFPTEEAYDRVFEDFIARVPRHGFLAVCADNEKAMRITRRSVQSLVLSYGFARDAQFHIYHHKTIATDDPHGIVQEFSVRSDKADYGVFALRLSGKHNACNAAAVVAVAQKLDIPLEKIKEGLRDFAGTARRFEFKGARGDALFFDDYAHHPEEVRATLRAAQERFPDRPIVAVFHPHTYSRTESMMDDFAQSFGTAREVLVLDVYPSAREGGRPERAAELSAELARRIDAHSVQRAKHCAGIDDAVAHLTKNLPANAVVMTLGAGDVWKLHDKMIDA